MEYKKRKLSDQNNPVNEKLLWNSFRRGNHWAFSKIFYDYYDTLYYFGCNFNLNQDELKDLIQDLFLKLWNSKDRLSKTDCIKAYLLKSFRRLVIDYYRNTRNEHKIPVDSQKIPEFIISHEDVIINDESEKDKTDKIQRALHTLSKREQEILYLKFYEKLDYSKIQQITELKYQSVRNIIHHALIKMRANMK